MNIRDLEYLLAVAKYQHFGKAAEACFVSQPALSMQVKKFEQTLGVNIFERQKKSVLITQEGQAIIIHAQKVLAAYQQMHLVAEAMQDPFGGVCRLGAFPTLAPFIFPKIMPKLQIELPKLEIQLIEDKTSVLLKELSEGAIDCALLAMPVVEESFNAVVLFKDEFYLAVANTNPLSKKRIVSVDDLDHQKVLLLEEGHCLRDQALALCHTINTDLAKQYRASSLETLREMVGLNEGVTLIPETAIRTRQGINYIPFKKPKPLREIALVWRKSSARAECFNKMCKVIS